MGRKKKPTEVWETVKVRKKTADKVRKANVVAQEFYDKAAMDKLEKQKRAKDLTSPDE